MAEELKYKVSIETDRLEAEELIAPSAIQSLVDLNKEVEEYRAQLRKLKEAEKEQGELTGEQAIQAERLKGRIKETSSEYQRQQREIVKLQTANNAAGNSYNDLVKQNAALSAAMRALPLDDTTGEMERLRAEYVKNNDELKKFDSAMGNNQRNVGNYQSALDGLGSALQSIPGPIGDIVRLFQQLQGVTSAVGAAFAGKEKVIQGFTASTVESTVAVAGQTTAEVAQTAAIGASAGAIGFDTTATVANTAATVGNTSATAANAGAQTAQAAGTVAATTATAAQTVAERSGVDERTVRRDGKYATALGKLPEVISRQIETGTIKGSEAAVIKLASLDTSTQNDVARDVRVGKAKTLQDAMKARGIIKAKAKAE
jgi:hypothetical protein